VTILAGAAIDTFADVSVPFPVEDGMEISCRCSDVGGKPAK
jgi:hypothetical protein